MKAISTAKTAGKWITDNKKPILIVLAVLVSIWITYKGIKLIVRYFTDKANKNDAEDYTGSDVTQGLHFNDLVNQIAGACGNIGAFGTDEEAIYGALEALKTNADWVYLKYTWTRMYDSGSRLGQIWQGMLDITRSLPDTLSWELSSKELQNCRDILTRKGITPNF